MTHTTDYPAIDGVQPETIRETTLNPDRNTYLCRAIYDFTDEYGVEVTIIPQYDPDDASAVDHWTILLANQAGGVPDAMKTLNETYDNPMDAVQYIKNSLDRLGDELS